jgi:hypothetical protein
VQIGEWRRKEGSDCLSVVNFPGETQGRMTTTNGYKGLGIMAWVKFFLCPGAAYEARPQVRCSSILFHHAGHHLTGNFNIPNSSPPSTYISELVRKVQGYISQYIVHNHDN